MSLSEANLLPLSPPPPPPPPSAPDRRLVRCDRVFAGSSVAFAAWVAGYSRQRAWVGLRVTRRQHRTCPRCHRVTLSPSPSPPSPSPPSAPAPPASWRLCQRRLRCGCVPPHRWQPPP